MKIVFMTILMTFNIFGQNTDSLLHKVSEIADMIPDEIDVFDVKYTEIPGIDAYRTEWLDMDIDFSEINEMKIQYALVFDRRTKLFSIYFAYVGRSWSNLERAIFKIGDSITIKPIKLGERQIIQIGYDVKQFFSTDWVPLGGFLYKFISTGFVKINFMGLERSFVSGIVRNNHKIIFAKFCNEMYSLINN